MSEDAATSCILVDMERLRVVFASKGLDRLGLEFVRAQDRGDADAEEFVEIYAAACRVRNMPVFSISSTVSPRWFRNSLLTVTKPRPGFDLDSRLARTVA